MLEIPDSAFMENFYPLSHLSSPQSLSYLFLLVLGTEPQAYAKVGENQMPGPGLGKEIYSEKLACEYLTKL